MIQKTYGFNLFSAKGIVEAVRAMLFMAQRDGDLDETDHDVLSRNTQKWGDWDRFIMTSSPSRGTNILPIGFSMAKNVACRYALQDDDLMVAALATRDGSSWKVEEITCQEGIDLLFGAGLFVHRQGKLIGNRTGDAVAGLAYDIVGPEGEAIVIRYGYDLQEGGRFTPSLIRKWLISELRRLGLKTSLLLQNTGTLEQYRQVAGPSANKGFSQTPEGQLLIAGTSRFSKAA